MNLAHPAALAWAALALPIVALYILKVRQRRVPVSTNLFWRQIFEEKRPRSLWETLRHLLSPLVQIALLGLLVLALAEPVFRWEFLRARRYVLVVDNSASMNATDGAPTRLASARAEGLRVIDALGPRDEMAVIAAGTEPAVACGLTGHQRTLRAALEGIEPTDGPTRVREAVELARRLLGGSRGRGSILLLTDAAFPGAAELLADDDVDAALVGRNTGNLAITRFQARRSLLDPVGYEILAEVANLSDVPAQCRLEIDLDSDVVDVVPLKLDAGDTWSKVIEETSAGGGRLAARLDKADALAADNQAWALLPRRTPRPVTLVTDGNLFLEKVLQAIPLVQLALIKDPPAAAGPGVTVLHRKVPATLPQGPVFVVDPAGPCDLWDLGEPVRDPIVAKVEKDSPLLAHVKLENVSMPEARRLAPKGGVPAQVLAASVSGEPLLAVFDRPGGKVVVLTVDLDKSDLPLQTAFPILMSNALSWFAAGKDELRESLASGPLAEADLPPRGAGGLALRAPDGRTRPLPRSGAQVTVGPLDRCGVWGVVPTGPGAGGRDAPPVAEFACNLANPRESDLRPPPGLKPTRLRTASGFGGRPAWFYLVFAAWGLAGLEWFLYQRRWIS
jgi:hypothetical protein